VTTRASSAAFEKSEAERLRLERLVSRG